MVKRKQKVIRTKIVSTFNQKGGSGKTTTIMLAAAEAARRGRNVMVIDCDRQSSAFRWRTKRGANNIYPTFPAPVVQMGWADVASKTKFVDAMEFLTKVGDVMSSALDYVFIDTPPVIDDPTVLGALAASDLIIVPMPLDAFHLDAFVEVQEKLIEAAHLRKQMDLDPFVVRVLVNKLKTAVTSERLIASKLEDLVKREAFNTALKMRNVYAAAANNRTTHFDTAGKKKEANDEVASLVDEIEEILL